MRFESGSSLSLSMPPLTVSEAELQQLPQDCSCMR